MATLQYVLDLIAQAPPEYRNFYLTIRGLEELIAGVLSRPNGSSESKDETIRALIKLYEPQLSGLKSLGSCNLPLKFGVDLSCPQCFELSSVLAPALPSALPSASSSETSSKPPLMPLINDLDAQVELKFGKWIETSSDDDYGSEDPIHT